MTLHAASAQCHCSQCAYFRARAERARQRMGLVPLYSPAAATRDAAVGGTFSPAVTTRDVTAGGSTSSALNAESAPEPIWTGLGSRSALDPTSVGGAS